MIRELPDGTVVAAYGPMLVTIKVLRSGSACARSARRGVREAVSIQEQLSRFSDVIRRNIDEVEPADAYPEVVNLMIASAKRARDPAVTPLIAVAGSVADLVADAIFADPEVSLAVVNNGGDIAVRMKGDAELGVGIRPEGASNRVSHVLRLRPGCGIGGVATSGFGGRSFTTGIASAAVAAGAGASLADVAATLIGNAVTVGSASVRRRPAREIDPDTDIPDHLVTTAVGALSDAEVEAALAGGASKARHFQELGLIAGAVIALRGDLRASDSLTPLLRPL